MRHGLAATLREQRSWKCSTFPLLLSSSAGHILPSAALSPAVLRAVPCPLHPARTARMERAGGSSRTAARHPGDLWLSTGSDPSWEV